MAKKIFLLSLLLSSFFLVLIVTAQTAPTQGGMLRVGLSPWKPDHLNPLLWPPFKVARLPIYNYLVRFNESGLIVPDLAHSWDISEDGLNYTFYLYQNVTWHDGVKFNASDVKFTFDTILNNPNVSPYIRDVFSPVISSVEIIGTYTVRFRLKIPYPAFLSSVAGGEYYVSIIPKHIYEGTNLSTNEYNYHPVGTGPFKFKEFVPKVNLTVVANENYFRGRPYLDNVTYRWDIPFEDLPKCLMNNAVDLVPENIDPNQIKELEKIPGITVTTSDDLIFFALGVNLNNPMLNNIKVRQAIAYAINKTKITEVSFLSYAKVATGPIPSSLSYWYNPSVPTYDYNSTRAEELLDEAGYPRNGEGVRFDITIKVQSGKKLHINASEIIKNYLKDAGINVTVIEDPNPYGSMTSRNFEFIFYGWGMAPDPDQIDLWHTEGWANTWNYSNTQLDNLLEQGRNTTDQASRKQIYDNIQYILATELPNIFLYYQVRVNDYNNDFHDFVTTPTVYSLEAYSLEKVWYNETLSGEGESPMLIAFIDSEGRRTGYDPKTGKVVEDISNTYYSGIDSYPQLVKILSPIGDYTIELSGTGNGSYKLEVVNIALDYKNVEIPTGYITEGEIIHYLVSTFPDGSIKVDKDSDLDGAGDSVDNCPTTAGKHQGCPVGDLNYVVLHVIDRTRAFCDGTGSCKLPLPGALVKVFDRNDPDFQSKYTKNPSITEYPEIFENDTGEIGSCGTNGSGMCIAGEKSTGDYLVIVKYEENGKTVYTGKPKAPEDFKDTDGDGTADLAYKDFQIIKVINKDMSIDFKAGSKTIVTGSILEVIYPQYTIWDSNQTIYPFIFTSDSDWAVDVCVYVPEGYRVIEGDCTQVFVTNETKYILFTIIDMQSPEPNMKINLKTKHRGRIQNLNLDISGIRKAKGLDNTNERADEKSMRMQFAAIGILGAFTTLSFAKKRDENF